MVMCCRVPLVAILDGRGRQSRQWGCCWVRRPSAWISLNKKMKFYLWLTGPCLMVYLTVEEEDWSRLALTCLAKIDRVQGYTALSCLSFSWEREDVWGSAMAYRTERWQSQNSSGTGLNTASLAMECHNVRISPILRARAICKAAKSDLKGGTTLTPQTFLALYGYPTLYSQAPASGR